MVLADVIESGAFNGGIDGINDPDMRHTWKCINFIESTYICMQHLKNLFLP